MNGRLVTDSTNVLARPATEIVALDSLLLTSLLVPDPAPFALLRRVTPDGPRVEVLTGEVVELSQLAELPLSRLDGKTEMLAIIPVRHVEPILALIAEQRATVSIEDALDQLPDVGVVLDGGAFDLPDEECEQVIDGEIRSGDVSNLVIRRSFRGTLAQYRPDVALTIFGGS